MKATKKVLIYAIALVMAVTCFIPVTTGVYATGESDQTAQTGSEQNQSTNNGSTESDAQYTGWIIKNGKRYYYKKGKIYTGWIKIEGEKRYCKKGRYYTGWIKVKGKKRYVKKGRYAKGWIKVKGKRYYCKKGLPIRGVKKIKKTWYQFGKKSGVLKRKIGDGMDKKAQKYSSDRKYLILVSYDKHRVRVYKGKKNKWVRKKNFKCSMGASSTPTPRGTYKVTSKGIYFNTGTNARCWYWTGFIGSIYLFHSVIYNRNSSPSHILDGRLERNISHGCIRLKLKNARWIYNNVPRRSKVVIY